MRNPVCTIRMIRLGEASTILKQLCEQLWLSLRQLPRNVPTPNVLAATVQCRKGTECGTYHITGTILRLLEGSIPPTRKYPKRQTLSIPVNHHFPFCV